MQADPIEYAVARKIAETNQQKAIAGISSKLQAKEDQFRDQLLRAKVGPAKKLEMLYAFMGELASAMSASTPCSKGCSSCCYYKVSVSEIEVAYIEKNTKHRRLKMLAPAQNAHGLPCPFLRDGSCSIYAFRPFVCRKHHALTPNAYWCHHERSDHEFPLLGFSSIDGAFTDIRVQANSLEPSDIRQYFS